MGSKGRIPPPAHLRHPLQDPAMLRPDPFGPGPHPPPDALPFDMMPRVDIMEEKFAAQDVEARKLLRENHWLAATHSDLRRELAAAQHKLQRLHAHMGAMGNDHDQHMRGLLDKMAKMEADLKASETVKVDLQKAHAEAQGLVVDRDELMAKAQHLKHELQKGQSDAQGVPALMSELQNLRQQYQQYRATYDYERKLRIDHFESLQVMEKNFMSMVREVEKLRAALTSANSDRSGGSYSATGGYKEGNTTEQRSVTQNVYEDVYGGPQGNAGAGAGAGAATYGGGLAGTPPIRPGYDAPPRSGPGYDAARVPAGYDNSRGGVPDYSKGTAAAATSYEAPRVHGYDAIASKGGGGAQAPIGAGNAPGVYGSAQAAAAAPYWSAQAQDPYVSALAPNQYGSTQAPPNPYGLTQASNAYGSALAPNPYASAQTPPPTGGAGQEAPSRGGYR